MQPNILPTEESIADLNQQMPTEETVTNMVENLNVNNNKAIQAGLNEIGDVVDMKDIASTWALQ